MLSPFGVWPALRVVILLVSIAAAPLFEPCLGDATGGAFSSAGRLLLELHRGAEPVTCPGRAPGADNGDPLPRRGELTSVAFLPLVCTPGLAPNSPEFAHLADHLVVRFSASTSSVQRESARTAAGARLIARLPAIGAEVWRVGDAISARDLVRNLQGVEQAELDYIATLFAPPSGSMVDARDRAGAERAAYPSLSGRLVSTALTSLAGEDPLMPEQWHHDVVHTREAWSIAGAAGVVVAIADTGVDCTHRDLIDRCGTGYDFVNNDEHPEDDQGHGTHVAGIALATAGNGLGGAGVAPEAKLMPLKVIGAEGWGSYTNLARALIWAADHGADVINLSVGGPAETRSLQEAVSYARSRGAVVVAAVGNSGSDEPQFPAAHEDAIGVGATSASDTRATFSNHGVHVDLSAPGVDILSTVPRGGYVKMSGTSMAAPVVAGAAALLAGSDPSMSPAVTQDLLQRAARDIGDAGWDRYTGYGRVDVGGALVLAASGPTAVPPSATPHPATPQPPAPTATVPWIRIGETVVGDANTDDPPDKYCFHGADWISIRMFGRLGFDPFLRLYSAGEGRLIAENDNGEGITYNSFLATRLPPGDYCLEAGGRGDGIYAVRVETGRSAGVGDVDHNCIVDLADGDRIADSMGSWRDGESDLDLDGRVAEPDLIIWRGNYARQLRCPMTAASSAPAERTVNRPTGR